MNTTLAIILTVVVTNWVHIGDFKDNSGRTFDVQEGQVFTNTIADVLLDEIPAEVVNNRIMNRRFGTTNRFILKSVPGPILAERKAVLVEWLTNWFFPQATNIWWTTNTYPIWNPPITNKFHHTNLYLWDFKGKKTYSWPAIKLEDE